MAESQNIEWKRSWHDDYLKWICGFANALGGTIFIGKDDDGNIKHLEDYKPLMESIPNKIRNALGVICEVNLHDDLDKKYIEIKVNPYAVPVSLRGRYYYRLGSVNLEMTGNILNEFLLKKAGKTWDDVIEEGASLGDLSAASIQSFVRNALKSNRMPEEIAILPHSELLEKLRLLTNGKLKRAAIILFGKDPNRFYPNIKVKIGRFGKDDADLKYHEEIEGNIFDMLQSVTEILNHKFLINPISFEGLQRIEKSDYPVEAFREMLLNALVHRSYMGSMTQLRVYDYQLSIWNEGNLPEGMEIESLKRHHVSRPRNPLIADVCFKAGFIDSWGRGTIKIYESCLKEGLPEPEITALDGGILVKIFKNKPKNTDQVNDQADDQVNDQVSNLRWGIFSKILLKNLLEKDLPTEKQYHKYSKIAERLSEEELKILRFCFSPKSNREIQEDCLELKKHTDNYKRHIEPIILQGALVRTLPKVPNSPQQKYFTSSIGKILILISDESKNKL